MILGGQISTSSLQKSLAHIERPHHVGDPEPWLVCKGTVVLRKVSSLGARGYPDVEVYNRQGGIAPSSKSGFTS